MGLRENKGKTLKALHSVYSIAKMNYKYYDTPEGQDCFLKMGYLTKNAAIFGVFAGVQDILLVSHPKGYAQTAGRFLYYPVPFSAMASTFAATSCVANSIRGKDDHLNYIIGGLSSGSIYESGKKAYILVSKL